MVLPASLNTYKIWMIQRIWNVKWMMRCENRGRKKSKGKFTILRVIKSWKQCHKSHISHHISLLWRLYGAWTYHVEEHQQAVDVVSFAMSTQKKKSNTTVNCF